MHGRVKSEIVILEILTHVDKFKCMWKFDFKGSGSHLQAENLKNLRLKRQIEVNNKWNP